MMVLSSEQLERVADFNENQNYLKSFHTIHSEEEKGFLEWDEKELIRETVNSLNSEKKALVHLVFWENKNLEDIAKETGKDQEKLKALYEESVNELKNKLSSSFSECKGII